MTTILDGKAVANEYQKLLKDKIKLMNNKPHLAVIKVGSDPASEIYINAKEKACKNIGIGFTKLEFDDTPHEEDIITAINALNKNEEITGIIVQLPLPKKLNERNILNSIIPSKDVDGLTSENMAKLYTNNPCHIPCTPKGVIELLKYYRIPLVGKNVVIIGRSNLVGKPLALLFLNEGATVTICHSKTNDLKDHTKTADILVSAVGKKHLITEDMVKENSTIIDIGVTREDKIYGDIDFTNVQNKVSYITPNPGGVGPMTITMLLENTCNHKQD